MRIENLLLALSLPGSAHFRAERTRRGLAWVAGIIVGMLLMRWTMAPLFVVYVAQIVDAAWLPAEPVSIGTTAKAMALGFVLTVGSAFLVRGFWIEAFKIPSGSMIPTLQVGDHIFVDKTVHRARRGDVVVFRYPQEPDKDFIKRVLAVGGDTIEFRDGAPIVNGVALPRVAVDGECSYEDNGDEGDWQKRSCRAFDETLDGKRYRIIEDDPPRALSFPARRVPDGQFFVVGDNRDNSHDSRFFGPVAESALRGRALYIWFSTGPHGVRVNRLQKSVP
jgi:signal peptidase I